VSSRQIVPEPGEFVMDFIDRLLAYADATNEPHYGEFNGTEVRVAPGGLRSDRRVMAFRAWEAALAA